MIKRYIVRIVVMLLIAAALPLGLFCCADKDFDDGKINIVCTVFPQYDWLRNIIGEGNERVELTLIVKNGADLHSYAATVRDIVEISSADMLVYVGGESDAWIEDAMAEASNKNMQRVNLLSLVGERALCVPDTEEEHHHEHEHGHEHGESVDEHIWLSLKNAEIIVRALARELSELDPEGNEEYTKNAEEYCKTLSELDGRYEKTVADSPRDTLLFADRFPFVYLMNDYGINYYAAFSGCSADSEASFGTVARLGKIIDEYSLSAVMTVDSGQTNIASAVIEVSSRKDCRVLSLDSMQSVRQSDIDGGVSYISIMEQNLKVLGMALS